MATEGAGDPGGAGRPRSAAPTGTSVATLWRALVDDAAVFPPASESLADAWRHHLEYRSAALAPWLGPLLLPASAAPSVAQLATVGDPAGEPVGVGIIGRPGIPLSDVWAALQTLAGGEAQHLLRVVGLEIAHDDQWHHALAWGHPLSVEVARDPVAMREAIAQLAAAIDRSPHPAPAPIAPPAPPTQPEPRARPAEGDDGAGAHLDDPVGAAPALRAKLRTQATEAAPVPSVTELAAFITGCVAQRVPFKLTGGLHHVVADGLDDHRASEARHGVFNVVLATHAATEGASHAEVRDLLLMRDEADVSDRIRGLTQHQVARLRTWFTSFGCCAITDPLADAARLHLAPVGGSEFSPGAAVGALQPDEAGSLSRVSPGLSSTASSPAHATEGSPS